MIDVALLSVIRRWRYRDGLAIREICRRTGLSRNTVRKYLKSSVVEPKYATGKRVSQLDPFEGKLAGWLETEPRKSRKQRRNLRRMYGDLVALARASFGGGLAGLGCFYTALAEPRLDLRGALADPAVTAPAARPALCTRNSGASPQRQQRL